MKQLLILKYMVTCQLIRFYVSSQGFIHCFPRISYVYLEIFRRLFVQGQETRHKYDSKV